MTQQEKEPLSPPDGFKMISEWSLGKPQKQTIVVRPRFCNDFSLYIALLSDGINPLLTIIFRSYSATHSKRKNYPTSV